jgi:6-pyruvoyl-tetrahydropterin synthase
MSCFDGAEICELVGLYILNDLSRKFEKYFVGLYRENGLALIKGMSGRVIDNARKDLCKLFRQYDLKITSQVCYQKVNFLDVTLDLKNESYQPYRKPVDEPLYINSHSNHPPSIIRQIPQSINKLISQLSSNQSAFDTFVPLYESALHRSNYDAANLNYVPNNNATNKPKRKRQRKIIWFNPPYSKNVKTNVAKTFLQLIDKHFPKKSKLHKIFNRNTIKVSYSCMENVKSAVSRHNHRILSKTTKATNTSDTTGRTVPDKKCNCRNANECPHGKRCLESCLVYQAEVITRDNGEIKHYIGPDDCKFI